jgi:hypothetical protein
MINLAVILAADLPAAQPTRVPRLVASDLVVILGLAGLIFVLFIAYLVFIRGSKSEIQAPRRSHNDEITPSDESNGGHRRKRKRVRRRDHRQRNPTLSQTGGLPPPRDPQQSSSPLG